MVDWTMRTQALHLSGSYSGKCCITRAKSQQPTFYKKWSLNLLRIKHSVKFILGAKFGEKNSSVNGNLVKSEYFLMKIFSFFEGLISFFLFTTPTVFYHLSGGEICVANFIPPVNGASLDSFFVLKFLSVKFATTLLGLLAGG